MGKDAKTSLVFSVAGLPTPLGLSSKVVQRGVEPALVFGAGFYSDLCETDMSWEERNIHGATFLGFHAFRKGMNRVQVKEQISTALRMAGPTLSEAKFRSIKNGKAIDKVVEMAEEMVIKEPKYMMWSSRKNPDNQVEFIRLEKPKSKQGKPKIIFRDVNTGEYNSLATSTFYKNFSKNVIHPPAERKVVKDLTKEEINAKFRDDFDTACKFYLKAIIDKEKRNTTLYEMRKLAAADLIVRDREIKFLELTKQIWKQDSK